MLTVLTPCKNEALNIGPCLDSARPLVQALGGEILVADSGSTDGTLDIVRSMPDCRLIQRVFVNFADFKNWAIPQAEHPWVLVVDADERITPELAAEIERVVRQPQPGADAYTIRRRNFFLGHEVRFGPLLHDRVDRLFKRDRCRYGDCRVHEGLAVPKDRLGKLRGRLLHYSISSYDDYFAKYVNYTRWGALDRWERGGRTSTYRLLVSPMLRFLWLYLFRGGLLDGHAGVQLCMLQAFFVTFVKQGRLWELEHGARTSADRPATILPINSENRAA